MLFFCTILASELVLAVNGDQDNDGFLDGVDLCPQSYGLVEGCFFYTQGLKKDTATLAASNIVLPTCTDPAKCVCQSTEELDMALPGDTLLIQLRGTTHVSQPFEVQ